MLTATLALMGRLCVGTRARMLASWLALLLLGSFWSPQAQAAAYATGGSGLYRPQVLWMTWGGGANGTAGAVLSNGATSSASLTINGVPLNVTCTLSNIRLANNTPINVSAYRSGTFTGDAFDDLYNIGGTDVANQLIAGIATGSGQTVLLTMTCSATLNGQPYDLPGVVLADAETSGGGEYVQASADGTWQIVERFRAAGCTLPYNGTLSQAGTTQTMRLTGPGAICASGPAAISFLTFNSTAYSGLNRQVAINVEVLGGGVSAVALGLLAPTADWSDAPASYGSAVHLYTPTFTNDSLAVGQTLDVFGAGFNVGMTATPTSDKIGALLDSDGISLVGNVTATADDTSGVDDEDAIGALPVLTTSMGGQVYTVPVQCTGTGGLAGWIDFNRDGDFLDANERSTNTPTCSAGGGTVNVTFTIPTGAGLVAGQSYLRLRYARNPATTLLLPTGIAVSGEAEDHTITIGSSTLTVTKISNGGTGSFAFTHTNTAPGTTSITTVTAGAATAGTATSIVAAGTSIVVTETAAPGWVLTGIACTKPAGGGTFNPVYDVPNRQVTIPAVDVDATATFACTFTNQRARTVTVNKSLNPISDAGRFNLQINGTAVATDIGNGGTGNNAAILIGSTVTVAEVAGTPNPGMNRYATTLSCTGATPVQGANNQSGTFTMPDADVICTFTNTRVPRTVTLRKALSPAADTGRFNLQVNGADVATNVGNGGSGSNIAVTPGTTVTIAELAGTPNVGLNGYTTTLLCTGATVTPGANNRSGTFTMPDANVDCTFTNTAIVNLAITKTATPAGTYLPGQPLNYTISVTNSGPAAASGIAVSDTVPATVTVSGWTWTATGAGADCDTTVAGTGATGATNTIALTSAALGPGQSLTIAVAGTAQLSATGAIVNSATATPPTGATCATPPCAVTDTTTNTDGGTPQLTIVKTATPGSFAVGQPATYSLQASNTGTSSTAGTISVSDPLPAGITATLPITAAGWDCTASTTTQVNCSTNTVLLPGSNAPIINVTIAVAPTTANPAVNTATVQGGGDPTCPATASHCTSTINTPVNAPRLDVVKSLGGNLVVGVQTTYTIQVTNGGTAATIAGGTVSDTIPSGLTIGTPPAGCSVSGQVVTCTVPVGLMPGNPVSFTYPVTPQASTSRDSVTNTATASGGGDPTCPAAGHCTGTTTDTVDAPQLSLTKTATPSPFVVNVPATYTLTLINNGTAPTTADATISDTIPGGLVIGAMPAGCALAGQVVTCTVASPLPTGTPVSFDIPVTPQASLRGLSVTNTATATGGGDPSCPASGDATTLPARCIGTTITNVNAPQLDIVKSASGANFVVGVAASYVLQVTNSGAAATTALATVSDQVPAGLVIDSAPGCTVAGQTVTCTIAAPFGVGAMTSFAINVTPALSANGQTLTNTATVQGGGDPTCPTNTHCASTVQTPVRAPQLTLVKTASASAFVVNVPASYTLTVTNTGSVATTAPATATDTIPSTLTLGAMPAGCMNSGQAVTCTVPQGLIVGDNAAFIIPVTPTAAASGTMVTNNASVSGGGDPTCPATTARCTSTTSTPVDAPQLTLTKTASATAFVVGVPATYTLTVRNTGTATTTAAATVTDLVPASLTLGAMPAGCMASGQSVTCTVPLGLAVGASAVFVLPVTPTAAANGTTVANTATVSGGGDPSCPIDADPPTLPARCKDSVTTPVNMPQLTVLKRAGAATFVVNQPASYSITVTNTGTAATTAVSTITDPLPANLLIGVPLPAACALGGQTVTCTIPAGFAPADAPVVFTIPVTPLPAASGSTLTNTATASGGGDPDCPTATHCVGTVRTPVNAPLLTIVKTASSAAFVVDQPASYTLTVTNDGSAATTADATVTDPIPAGLTLGTPLPPGCTVNAPQTVACTIPLGLQQNQQVQFVIPVTPTAAASGTTLSNTATVGGGGDDTCPTADHCASTVEVPVDMPRLRVVKTANAAAFTVNVPASYTLTVTNIGSAATTQPAAVSDPIPASLDIGAPLPADCTATGQTVRCTIAPGLATNAQVQFVIPVTPTAAASGTTVSNTATVGGGGNPRCPLPMPQIERGGIDPDCRSTVDVPVDAPLLTIVKTASAASFMIGEAASYTLTITNSGTAATTGPATIEDPVPATLTLGTMPPGCANSGQVVTCTIAAGLAPNAQVQFVIPVTPTAAASGTIGNTATITRGDPACPQAGRCSSTVDVPVGELLADLRLTKDDGGGLGIAGRPITWTLTASNHGPNDAVDVVVRDPMPPGLTFVSAGGNGWICGQGGGMVSCTRPALVNGASAAITLTLAVPAGYAGPSPIVNTANVTSTTPDPDPDNNSGTDDTPTRPREVMPVPALSWPALLGMILMLGGFALVTRARRLRS